MVKLIYPSEWLKIGVNVEAGDHIRFLDAGVMDPDKGSWEFNVGIIHNGAPTESKKFNLNKTNSKAVVELYGDETDSWVGKLMKIASIKVRNPQSGAMVDSIALEKPDAQLAAADGAGMVAK